MKRTRVSSVGKDAGQRPKERLHWATKFRYSCTLPENSGGIGTLGLGTSWDGCSGDAEAGVSAATLRERLRSEGACERESSRSMVSVAVIRAFIASRSSRIRAVLTSGVGFMGST